MNTEYLYLSNIPSNIKPVLLLHELNNKWARMLYLENSFSGMRDALVYNPVRQIEEMHVGVDRLRSRELEGMKALCVNYVFFPPANVFLTTMIPDGASMLSYILLENIHKDVLPPEIIADLPLQATDLKPWDIPERSDKCLLIKLPTNCSNPMRSFILGTLRSRVIRGFCPKVSELIISENPILGSQMVPRQLRLLDSGESYQSNFFYLHEIPSRVTVKMLVETTKSENIKGGRVFFLETYNNMKFGFLYVPKSLPNDRFMALYNKLADEQFEVSNGDKESIKVAQVWFQPDGADSPSPLSSEDDEIDEEEMLLSDYVYISGVPSNVAPQQLMFGCPVRVKLSLFSVNEMDTQLGFLLLRGIGEIDCIRVISHFRGLSFNGCNLEVHEIHLRCRKQDLNGIHGRPFHLIPRTKALTMMMLMQQQQQQNPSSNLMTSAALLLQQQQQFAVAASTSNINNAANLASLSYTKSRKRSALAASNVLLNHPFNNSNITILTGGNGGGMTIASLSDDSSSSPPPTGGGSSFQHQHHNSVSSVNGSQIYGQLTQLPDDEYSLMKTEFLCVDNLPRNVGMAALLFNIGKVSDGAVMMPSVGSSKAFIYFPNCTSDEWLGIINSLLRKSFSGRQPMINEVYLQTDELTNPESVKLIADTSMVFAYNIANAVELGDIYHLDPELVSHADMLETTNGSKSAFILLKSSTTDCEANNFIASVRKSYIQGKPLYADKIKLAPVHIQQSNKKKRI